MIGHQWRRCGTPVRFVCPAGTKGDLMPSLRMNEAKLDYWDTGAGHPIVFVHGVATLGELWVADLSDLTDEFRVVAYNRRGYGASSSSPRNWTAHADDTIALIESLGIAPALIVGYSAGSIVALDLALRRSDLVSGLVLLDPAFNLTRCLTPSLLTTLLAVKALALIRKDHAAARRWLRYVSSYSTGGSAYEQKASDERRAKLLANRTGILADLESGGGAVDETRLASISVPVTIVAASLSPSFLRRSCHRLSQLLPQADTVVLEHSGHRAGLDARDEVVALLRDAARACAPG